MKRRNVTLAAMGVALLAGVGWLVLFLTDDLAPPFGRPSTSLMGVACAAVGLLAASLEWAMKDATGRGFPTWRLLALGVVGFGILLVLVSRGGFRWSTDGPSRWSQVR